MVFFFFIDSFKLQLKQLNNYTEVNYNFIDTTHKNDICYWQN